jgi:hypothetical protein
VLFSVHGSNQAPDKLKMKYTTSYTSSNGQPSNGHETHETLNAALAAWESNIRALLHCSGGDSTLQAWEDADLDSEHAQPSGSVSWIEHCEGGYACGDGIFSDDLAHYARYEQENGDELTAAKVVRHLSE